MLRLWFHSFVRIRITTTCSDVMPVTIALDYGDRRCGFAVSDPEGMIAFPLETREVHSDQDRVTAVKEVCADRKADQLVVGIPTNMDGSAGTAVEKVERLIVLLEDELEIPVLRWDERLTTALVDRVLIEADVSRAKRKGVVDKLAAQAILQGFLDSQIPGHEAL